MFNHLGKVLMKTLLFALCLMFGGQLFAGEQVTLTKDNTIAINDEFDAHAVSNIAKLARELDSRIPSSDPLYLVINSPGGSIEDGLELISNLSNLKRPVTTITLFSASMGFQTVEALGPRLITSTGTLMSHRASGGFFGQMPGSLGTRYAFYLKRVQKMDENAVRRSGGKLTKASYATLIQDEYWCEGDDCIAQGLADKIVSASCDKSLTGVSTISIFQALIQGLVVEIFADYENCPLNTNVLKYTLLINGEPLFHDGVSAEELHHLLSMRLEKGVDKKDTTPTNTTGSIFGPSLYSYDYSSSRSVLDTLTKDQLTEINEKFQQIVKQKNNREVIKGY
jgi:ATP-dependent protease ClpP protease subunit